ncbi:MAG: hypothetical protein A3A27_01005 [Candidatus Wildermuthbacteria bacterium RIFCSPLOWO2_01_FULL_47_18]|uniref:Type-4 uracil-DNA glycosylase n=1 Tax=Candidatus Wildermuthbacteria bacterium RIFCSPLOWO2_01_FULL_47_18 TaxID=1802460 RepID=A0A1G2RJV5_9BACT|nr:MAG: hypothetical protein A3A27_01005 [Candidatus Wildermuthbacteria bacterium RIFCSPLOWO2_01_FULL_47_18]OHB17732.1 MAG: hypothetical protein A2749_01690 [Parcubacteria group bacterium RIFCSPHIGHO2_01_FULL_45_26]
MNKREALDELRRNMQLDKSLPLAPANLVFGEGNVDCQVMFVGEAPGAEEDRLIRPFVGRSGKLLDKMIEALGWKRSDVYITNIVKRRPPDNRDPLPEEIEAYKPYLARQIEVINPKIIATLGRFSMNYFLPLAKITRDQGKPYKLIGHSMSNQKGLMIFPLFHPAAILRGAVPMPEYEQSFRKLATIVAGANQEFGPF